MICDVDQRDALIGMNKAVKQTHVFLFCISAHKGWKLIKAMLGVEESSYHLHSLDCRTVVGTVVIGRAIRFVPAEAFWDYLQCDSHKIWAV